MDYKLEVTSCQSKVLVAVPADRLCYTSALSEHFNNSNMQGLQFHDLARSTPLVRAVWCVSHTLVRIQTLNVNRTVDSASSFLLFNKCRCLVYFGHTTVSSPPTIRVLQSAAQACVQLWERLQPGNHSQACHGLNTDWLHQALLCLLSHVLTTIGNMFKTQKLSWKTVWNWTCALYGFFV